MRLTIKMPNRSKVFMTVPDSLTIGHIKKCIKDVSTQDERFEPNQQNIIFRGKLLGDATTLSDPER